MAQHSTQNDVPRTGLLENAGGQRANPDPRDSSKDPADDNPQVKAEETGRDQSSDGGSGRSTPSRSSRHCP